MKDFLCRAKRNMMWLSRLYKIQVVLAVTILALLSISCCPYPHYEREAPIFEGTLARRNVVAANVRVTLSTRIMSAPGCANPKVETHTDAGGKFYIDPPKYFSPVIGIGDRRDAWSLCFQFADGLVAIWEDDGYWGGPSPQILECAINDDNLLGGTLQLLKTTVGKQLLNGCHVESISDAARTKTREAQPTSIR